MSSPLPFTFHLPFTFTLGFMVCSVTLSAAEPLKFRDVTDESGIRAPLAGLLGHGAAVGDFDDDGFPDVFVGGFCDRPNEQYAPSSGPVKNMLLRNIGGHSLRVVDQKEIGKPGRTSGAVFADLDNDGTLDLVIANNSRDRVRGSDQRIIAAKQQRSRLLRNEKGIFFDATAQSGLLLDNLLSIRNVGVFDFDRDGRLDLFLVEDRFRGGGGSCRLLRNLGGLKFQEATTQAAIPGDIHGLGLAIADVNDDGWPDLFVPHSNRMLISTGQGKYVEPPHLRRVFQWDPLDSEDWPCGAAFADLNNDGRLDLVVSVHSVTARNRVFLNRTNDQDGVSFVDVTSEVGLGDAVPVRCPHVEVQDFNNDSLPDIYVSAAWRDEDGTVQPLIYLNQGITDGIPYFSRPRPHFDDSMVYFPAGPTVDFNQDGKLDLFLVNWFSGNHSRLLLNESREANWLKLKVKGSTNNQMGIGARIEVYRSGRLRQPNALLGVREVATGYGYASGQVAECHFGLADHEIVDIHVRLPNGDEITRRSVECCQRLIIEED